MGAVPGGEPPGGNESAADHEKHMNELCMNVYCFALHSAMMPAETPGCIHVTRHGLALVNASRWHASCLSAPLHVALALLTDEKKQTLLRCTTRLTTGLRHVRCREPAGLWMVTLPLGTWAKEERLAAWTAAALA